jgi:hypothetical protein
MTNVMFKFGFVPAARELGVAEFNRVLPVGKTQRSP